MNVLDLLRIEQNEWYKNGKGGGGGGGGFCQYSA